MQVWPAAKIRVHAVVAAVLIAAGLASLASEGAPIIVAVLGVGAGALWYLGMTWRYYRRRRLVSTPFPDDWRRVLERRVAFYCELDAGEDRRRFEDDVRIFLAEQRIYGTGPEDARLPLGDETRLLIAASAAILGHGMPRFEWPRLRDVVVYPRAFDEDYHAEGHEGEDIAGMVHAQGPILYSERDLRRGFRRRDGHNVGLHELAHVLDFADGHADGHPVGAQWASAAPWTEIIADRLARLRRHRYPHVLRDYAGTNEAEFFAVAVEAFFERPRALQNSDAELYEMLCEYFGQDPASKPPRRRPGKFH